MFQLNKYIAFARWRNRNEIPYLHFRILSLFRFIDLHALSSSCYHFLLSEQKFLISFNHAFYVKLFFEMSEISKDKDKQKFEENTNFTCHEFTDEWKEKFMCRPSS